MRHCETCTGASALSAHESSNTIIPRTARASGAHEKGKIPPGKKLRAPQERNRTRGACARAGERGAAMLAAILAGASPARELDRSTAARVYSATSRQNKTKSRVLNLL